MRNTTKKITAIAAALLLATSGVATTAAIAGTTASAEIAVGTEDTTKITVTVDGKDPTAHDDKIYEDATAATEIVLDSLTGTYNYGAPVKPVEEKLTKVGDVKGVYVKYATDKAVFVPVTVAYENNTNAGKAKAIITGSTTEVIDDETIVATVRLEKEFTIEKATLKDTTVAAAVKKTWDGGTISINKAELPLSRTIPATATNEEYTVPVDSSLYKLSNIKNNSGSDDPTDVKEKGGVLTFKAAPGTYDVTYSITDAAKANFKDDATNTVAKKAVIIENADWNDVVIDFGDQTNVATPNVTVTLNGNKLTQGTHYTATSAAASTGSGTTDNTLAEVTVEGKGEYFDNVLNNSKTGYAAIGNNIATKIKSVKLADPTKIQYTYTGSEIKPEVVVETYNNETLTEGVDYEIVYENNVNVGPGKQIVVKGIGKYAGTVTSSSTYTIVTANIADMAITTNTVAYETTLPTAKDLYAAIKVNDGAKDLELDEDYIATLVGSVKEGENKVRLMAKSENYKGSTTVTVNVVKAEAPAAPTDVKVKSYTDTTAKLTFAAVEGATGYEIYNGETKVATASTQDGAATITKTVAGLDADTAYNFTVKAVKTTGDVTKVSDASEAVAVTTRLPKVTGLKAIKKTKTTLKLQFNAVEGADAYRIYDAETGKALANVTTQNGAAVLKKTVTGLKAGETRKYKVRAISIQEDGSKVFGVYSSVYTKDTAK